ncbi:hypothetical protein M0R45_026480 [Rubus argutus]|uniref:Uncharacterized protein n=1 Tax=Rubus argutus TaxID=59490 RepID=A0AAW1WXM8_RUBAR
MRSKKKKREGLEKKTMKERITIVTIVAVNHHPVPRRPHQSPDRRRRRRAQIPLAAVLPSSCRHRGSSSTPRSLPCFKPTMGPPSTSSPNHRRHHSKPSPRLRPAASSILTMSRTSAAAFNLQPQRRQVAGVLTAPSL